MAWECLRAPLIGHFLLGRFASQEAGPDLVPLALLRTDSAFAWVQFEEVEVFTLSLCQGKVSLGLKVFSIYEVAVTL